MGKDYNNYLKCDISELLTQEAKQSLICGEKYNFIWFCQNASQEQIEALLGENGVELLLSMPDASQRIEGGILNGFTDNNLLKNPILCDFINKNNCSISNSMEISAKDYFSYLLENEPEKINSAFSNFHDSVQISILQNFEFLPSKINELLFLCKEKSMEYLINNNQFITLDDINYSKLSCIAEKNISIPHRLITKKLIERISTIDDVNAYRFLINNLSENNDVSDIEKARKRYYEKELNSINEEGLLPEYAKLKEHIKNNGYFSDIGNILGNFHSNQEVIEQLLRSKDYDKTIKKLNDYKITNMVIDYLFEEVPTNIIADLNSMIEYQRHNLTLNEIEYNMYFVLSKIDLLDTQKKLDIFNKLKDKDVKSKLYDDFSYTREKMVENINKSILNEDNVANFKDDELSEKCQVPVYHLKGQPFYALVRAWGAAKDEVLNKNEIDFRSDGSSFSLDSSKLLKTYVESSSRYVIAYSGIPAKQLIHAFPTDSYSNYIRNSKGVPDRDSIATDRIFNLMTPEELTTTANSYNEIIISVPNSIKKARGSELDEKLEAPKPLAIYCYDNISPEDIESAKNLGIGIILVDTKSYEIDTSDRLNATYALSTTQGHEKHKYVSSRSKDSRRDIER